MSHVSILFGPPGAGKTTIGRKVAELYPEIFFASVGEYMRTKLALTPPFNGVDRNYVLSLILSEFKSSSPTFLLLDCNPYPTDMWDAVQLGIISLFPTSYILITAPKDILIKRLTDRGRVDHPNFSYEDRLEYYYQKVVPAIGKIKTSEEIIELRNLKVEDIHICAKVIAQTYGLQ